ncbi:glycosyltransferase family 4 protein [Pseudohalioglobus lutimaris]|uniref:Glycosyl transferase family 1 domain-containing protein n=1 Tax=Pseudohalioglobus lutimaris TaxID=1737061 RepID=A0A2N5X1J5_9GAMM|nr:glycosyltransferase family 4 protein [Pseudohalioglobus lutimaris]PLW68330.1 hypothetical protein C0039_13115 [Pseudohalioglobus lutimaris]
MKKLVIGTSVPAVAPGGIPTFIGYLKKSDTYSDCHFLEWCDRESGSQLSLGDYSRNKFFRTIASQFKVLSVAHRYEEIEVHSIRTGLFALIFFRRKCSFFYHGPGFQEAAVEGSGELSVLRLYIVEALMLRNLRKYYTASRAFRRRLHENHGVPIRRIEVVRPQADFDRYRYGALVKKKFNSLDKNGIISCVICRRLVNRVGVIEFLEALRAIDLDEKVRVTIVGSGPLEDRVRSASTLDERVVFLGELTEAERDDVYSDSHFNVVPTLHLEGLGMVIYEGLKFGAIPLVTACDGMPELLEELEVGEYFENVKRLILAIDRSTIRRELNRLCE